jgi:uncharacterized RDD family membrane protein YckC
MAKPGLLKLLAVIFYDSILLLAVLFAATYLVLPLNHGEAFSNRPIAYPLYLLSVCFAFYGWFWTHGGQTLGMRTWKLKLLSDRGLKAITWKQALIRFVFAMISWLCFGLGFIWIALDKNHRSWHDIVSKSGLYSSMPPES